MQKVFCDRCGKECKGTTHYLIRIYGKDNNPSMFKQEPSFETVFQNLQTNIETIIKPERQYCRQCKDEFEKFLFDKPSEEIPKTDKNNKISPFLKRWLGQGE